MLLILYHSGTANTDLPESSVAKLVKKLRQEKGIIFFAVSENGEPINLKSYETGIALLKAGVIPLYNISRIVAKRKLQLLHVSSAPNLITEMLKNQVGELDESMVSPTEIKKLKLLY